MSIVEGPFREAEVVTVFPGVHILKTNKGWSLTMEGHQGEPMMPFFHVTPTPEPSSDDTTDFFRWVLVATGFSDALRMVTPTNILWLGHHATKAGFCLEKDGVFDYWLFDRMGKALADADRAPSAD